MNRKSYRKIAKNFGVSIQEVKRDMQIAVDKTYETPNLYTRCIDCKDEKPTVDEFVNHAARRAILKQK